MSLTGWLANGWIVAHQSSIAEIAELFAVVDRDLEDAAIPRLSAVWRIFRWLKGMPVTRRPCAN